MNESSKNKEQHYSDLLSLSGSVIRCHNDIMCCDEIGAEVDETNTGDDLVEFIAFHENNDCDLSEISGTNASRPNVPVNQKFSASSDSIQAPYSSHNISTCCCIISQNGEFLKASQNQVHDPFVKDNSLAEVNHWMALPTNGFRSTLDDVFHPLSHRFHSSSTSVHPLPMPLPVTTGSSTKSTHNETPRQNIIAEQIDGGFMEEAEAYAECSDSDSMTTDLVNKKGSGVHLPFEMDIGIAVEGTVEDIGDFIDADIPQHRNGSSQFSSRSNDSVTSSFEELMAVAVVTEKAETEKVDSYVLHEPTSTSVNVGTAEERIRFFSSAVNNLNHKGRSQDSPKNNLTDDDFGTVFCQTHATDLVQSDSSSFDGRETLNYQGKHWRWSDGDEISNLSPSMTSATSLASELSDGAPSAASLMSPLSTEDDEAVVSALSSPECLSRLRLAVDSCSLGMERLCYSENLNRNRNERDHLWSKERISEFSGNCTSCNNLLENMNMATSKHILEKFIACEMTSDTDRSSASSQTRHLQGNDRGSRHPLVLNHSGNSCLQCNSDRQRMSTSLGGEEISNSEFIGIRDKGVFDTYSPERPLQSISSDDSVNIRKNRRFSYQNLVGTGPLDCQSSCRAGGYCRSAQNGSMTSTLSENSLQSTQLLKSHPFSLLLNSQRTRDCLDGGCQRIRTENGSRRETKQRLGSKLSNNKKISACAQSTSLSEEEREEEVTEEGRNTHNHHHHNGHHCRYGNEVDFACDLAMCDVNISRSENNGASKLGLKIACCQCPVNSLLDLLGVGDFGRHACDLFPADGLTEKKASLPEYLISCSTAGVTAEQLISRIAKLTKDLIFGKFFHFYPQRYAALFAWLKYWIRKGAVPLVTRKYEFINGSAESWKHRLLHPAWEPDLADALLSENVAPAATRSYFADSSLRISRRDIVSRWHDDCDLSTLVTQTDARWHRMNVLGQVVNILREERLHAAVGGNRPQLTSHVVIPSHFKSGVTLYVRTDSASYAELESSTGPEFPSVEQLNGKANESRRQILKLQKKTKAKQIAV